MKPPMFPLDSSPRLPLSVSAVEAAEEGRRDATREGKVVWATRVDTPTSSTSAPDAAAATDAVAAWGGGLGRVDSGTPITLPPKLLVVPPPQPASPRADAASRRDPGDAHSEAGPGRGAVAACLLTASELRGEAGPRNLASECVVEEMLARAGGREAMEWSMEESRTEQTWKPRRSSPPGTGLSNGG